MEKLIIQQSRRYGRISEFVKSSGTSLTLGRGFNNDVILSDHFIAPEQLRFDYMDGKWNLKVLDDTNPVLINNKPINGDETSITSGDELIVGRTHLVLLLSNHPVERTRSLILSNWMANHRLRMVLPIIAVVVSIMVAMLTDYQETSDEVRWGEMFAGGLFFGFLLIIWAASWALAGRLLRHKPNFFPQLFYTALIMAVLTVGTLFSGYAEYATSSSGFGSVIETTFLVLIFTVLLKYNLKFATELKRRGLTSFSLVAVLALFVIMISYLEEKEFSALPEYSKVIKPPLAKWATDKPVDSYLNDLDTKFSELQEGAN
jgi:hypothetical protein